MAIDDSYVVEGGGYRSLLGAKARSDGSKIAAVIVTDENGTAIGGPQSYWLLKVASATGAGVGPVKGGQYIWSIQGTFGGATATLQELGLDNTTWVDVKNADGSTLSTTSATSRLIIVGHGASIRVAIAGGSNVSLNSTVAGI